MRLAALAPAIVALALGACKVRELPPIEQSYADTFDRAGIGPDYNQTGTGYRIKDGALNARGAHNRPLWLGRKLPAGNSANDLLGQLAKRFLGS